MQDNYIRLSVDNCVLNCAKTAARHKTFSENLEGTGTGMLGCNCCSAAFLLKFCYGRLYRYLSCFKAGLLIRKVLIRIRIPLVIFIRIQLLLSFNGNFFLTPKIKINTSIFAPFNNIYNIWQCCGSGIIIPDPDPAKSERADQ